MKLPSAPLTSAIAALLLVFTWGCQRTTEAGPKTESHLPPNMIVIQPGSQETAGLSSATARLRPLPLTTTAVGSLTVNEDKTDHIGVLFAGVISEVLVKVGDHVKRGQVLARLHSHDLHDAVSAYRTALAEAERTRRLIEFTLRNRERYESLYQIKFASKQESEQAAMEYRNALADHDKAQAMLQAARIHLGELLEVADDKISPRDLNADTIPLRTPRSGVVLDRYITPGMVVNPGTQAFTVSGLHTVWMMAAVNEENLAGLQIGMPATIRVRAYPGVTFDGRVIQLGPQLDPATRTLTVRILITNLDGRLRPEMFATAEIVRGVSRKALFVPETAVQTFNDNPVVFVRHAKSEFEVRPVKQGSRVDGEIEITDGLRNDEEVVTSGAFVVKSQFLTRSLSQE